MGTFKAFRIDQSGEQLVAGVVELESEALTAGEVLIEVLWSGINYKDALAGTGRGQILRRPVLNGGIDLAGRVLESSDESFQPGDAVFSCGTVLSETLDGGFAERARVPAEYLRAVPEGLGLRDTMAIGTAGFTAAIALERLARNGQRTELGPLLVNGASGGVGSFAVHLASRLGYEVVASTGKREAEDYLRTLGAARVIDRIDTSRAPRPLEAAQWGAAIDSLGGASLAWLASTVKPWGNIACIGLADSAALETSVMPLILRGVSLLGVNCLQPPTELIEQCWTRLAEDWRPEHLDRIAPHEVTLDGLADAFEQVLAGAVTGRILVRIGDHQEQPE